MEAAVPGVEGGITLPGAAVRFHFFVTLSLDGCVSVTVACRAMEVLTPVAVARDGWMDAW